MAQSKARAGAKPHEDERGTPLLQCVSDTEPRWLRLHQ